MNITVLIMVGGRRERFRPRSRRNTPKQFLTITDDGKTMIQLAVERTASLVKMEDIYIVTNKDYRNLVLGQLPGTSEDSILCEPVSHNTAPCIELGAVHASKKHKDALMLVLSPNHLIKSNKMLVSILRGAYRIVEMGDNLVTIDIMPGYPGAGYGHTKFNNHEMEGRVYKVGRFVEKPSLEVAREYLVTEEYLWNSGVLTWKVSSILKNIKRFTPAMYKGLEQVQSATGTDGQQVVLEQEFNKMEPRSIDYGIIERAKDIYILPSAFGWDDVGSQLAIERIKKSNEFGNVVDGNVTTVNTHNRIIQGDRKLITTVGFKDIVVVDIEDVISICERDSTGDAKRVLGNLKICNRDEYIQIN